MPRTLTKKVAVVALIVLVLITITAAFTIVQILSLRQTIDHVSDDVIAQSQVSGEFNTYLTSAISELQTLTQDVGEFGAVEEALTEAQTNVATLDRILTSGRYDPMMLETYRELNDQRQSMIDALQRITERISADVNNDAGSSEGLSIELQELEQNLARVNVIEQAALSREQINATERASLGIQRALVGASVNVGIVIVVVLLALLLLNRSVVQPVRTLAATAQDFARGHFSEPVGITSNDEIGSLQHSFNIMADQISQQTRALTAQVAAAEAAQTKAEAAQNELAAQLAIVEEQRAVIQRMSVPVLPISDSVLVMPLIGALDTERLQLVQEVALQAIERAGSRYLLLDITGVPIVDASVARGLFQTIEAVRLLGAQIIIVGVRPEVAQALVGLGVEFNGVVTQSTLQSGISFALR